MNIIAPIHVLVIEDGDTVIRYIDKTELDMWMQTGSRFPTIYKLERTAADVPAFIAGAQAHFAHLASLSGTFRAAYYVADAPVTVFGGGE
jgi:hypothetical protein